MQKLAYEMQGLTWQARKKNQQDAILFKGLSLVLEQSFS